MVRRINKYKEIQVTKKKLFLYGTSISTGYGISMPNGSHMTPSTQVTL